MPRGGKRDKAGRKSSWASGVKFEETVLIRVPKYIRQELLELAHELDAGNEIELVTDSMKQEKKAFQNHVFNLEEQIRNLTKSPKQLDLFEPQGIAKSELHKMRDRVLLNMGYGKQSRAYIAAKKAFNSFINELFK